MAVAARVVARAGSRVRVLPVVTVVTRAGSRIRVLAAVAAPARTDSSSSGVLVKALAASHGQAATELAVVVVVRMGCRNPVVPGVLSTVTVAAPREDCRNPVADLAARHKWAAELAVAVSTVGLVATWAGSRCPAVPKVVSTMAEVAAAAARKSWCNPEEEEEWHPRALQTEQKELF